ncbi:nitrilase-related carbon-nitrogen hydrolase [Nonomuraea sediminis]|uniref:nitrilase-related carbon-nitrogen hydrolase n=1 Tax=Nonomuraea sediminis TaxID=2835864 RepID=UPI001BDBB231|nr:nitrilase-related carbon-nitrogen hydrolase [Nonomuraea sediminis]
MWKPFAVVLSAVLFVLGTGLHPVPWFTWLAALPVLVVAARVRFRAALVAGFAAWALGQVPMWGYFLNVVEMPLPVLALSQLAPSLLFGLLTAGFSTLVRRGRPVSAALLVPAGWALVEYAFSVAMPHGAWWSLAYTQADLLPVLQTASLTGVWGVTFLLLAVPSAIAAALSGTAGRLRLALTFGTVVAVALAYGTFQLLGTAPAGGPRIALLVTDHPNDTIPVDTAEGRDLVARYAARAEALAASGVRTIVLPEKTFRVGPRTMAALAPLNRVATRHRVTIVAGLVQERGQGANNVALALPSGVRYVKKHLIPGVENEVQPGEGAPALLPGTTEGLIICKDLDYPELVRASRARGATVLYAPAWDFVDDGWLHGRMAVTRGVESGMTVARAARAGTLVVSDPRGRIVAETTSDGDFATLTTSLPGPVAPTPYSRLGDWFPWACAAILAATLATTALRRHPKPPAHQTTPHPQPTTATH